VGFGVSPDSVFLPASYVLFSRPPWTAKNEEEFEMAVDVKTAIQDLIRNILGDRDAAAAYAADPEGTLAEAGVTGAELTAADIREAVDQACSELDLSPQVQGALQTYSSQTASTGGAAAPSSAGAPPPPPAVAPPVQPPMEMVQQHLNYVTYVSYEGDESITQEITNNIDNSTAIDQSTDINLDVGEHNDGDITIDVNNVSASGDGAVAAGDDVENAQTGDGGVLIDGNNDGGIATGDGAVATGEDSDDNTVNTGEFTGVQTGENSDVQAVVGDGNTTVQADGDVNDTSIVSGDVGGDVTSIGDLDADDSAVNFGDGSTVGNVSDIDTNGGDANVGQNLGDGINQVDTSDTAAAQGGGDAFGDVDDAAVNTGSGEATNVSDLDDGSAAAVDSGDATGSEIDDSFNDNVDSAFEQGPGDQDVTTQVIEPEPTPEPDMTEDMGD
jgi:hypothetical protein